MVKIICQDTNDSPNLVVGQEYDGTILDDGKAVSIMMNDGYLRYYPISNFIIKSEPNLTPEITSETYVFQGKTYVSTNIKFTIEV